MRYYTQCQMTPSLRKHNRNNKVDFEKIWPRAAPGYLFYDSEGLTNVQPVVRAMWTLSSLYEGVKCVYAVRVDANTIAASFSTNGLPRPERIALYRNGGRETYEYLSTHKPKGWLVDDINDVNTAVREVDYDMMFDGCGQLERMTDNCPCPRLAEGTCFSDTVYKEWPALPEELSEYLPATNLQHQTNRFKEIAGFEFVPGAYTINSPFVEGIRPWDYHDFTLVTLRKKDYADTGALVKRRNAFKKSECAHCAFGRQSVQGKVYSCGRIDYCDASCTPSDVKKVLESWVEERTPYLTGSEGFSRHEIAYLITISGTTANSRIFTPTRDRPTMFAGFDTQNRHGHLQYKVAPGTPNEHRSKYYNTYEELRADFPTLDEQPFERVTMPQIVAHAVFASKHEAVVSNPRYFRRYYIETNYGYTVVYGIRGRRVLEGYVTVRSEEDYVELFRRYFYGQIDKMRHYLSGASAFGPHVVSQIAED